MNTYEKPNGEFVSFDDQLVLKGINLVKMPLISEDVEEWD